MAKEPHAMTIRSPGCRTLFMNVSLALGPGEDDYGNDAECGHSGRTDSQDWVCG